MLALRSPRCSGHCWVTGVIFAHLIQMTVADLQQQQPIIIGMSLQMYTIVIALLAVITTWAINRFFHRPEPQRTFRDMGTQTPTPPLDMEDFWNWPSRDLKAKLIDLGCYRGQLKAEMINTLVMLAGNYMLAGNSTLADA